MLYMFIVQFFGTYLFDLSFVLLFCTFIVYISFVHLFCFVLMYMKYVTFCSTPYFLHSHQLLTVHIPQLNWGSKEDVDVVAFFEYMVSKEADPGFVAKAIINAKAKKKADEDAAEHARKKTKTSSKELETQESSTTASDTGVKQRP